MFLFRTYMYIYIIYRLINGGNRNRNKNMNIGYWNICECMELSSGISDFGICSDKINNRIYICGGFTI